MIVDLYLNDSRPPQGFLGEAGKSRVEKIFEDSVLFRLEVLRRPYRFLRTIRYGNHPDLKNRFAWAKRYSSEHCIEDEREWNAMLNDARFDWGTAWNPNNWQIIDDYLGRIRAFTHVDDMELYVVLFPVSPQLEVDYKNRNLPQRLAHKILSKHEIEYRDTLERIYGRYNKQDIYEDQCHLNETGHSLTAELLFQWLSNRI